MRLPLLIAIILTAFAVVGTMSYNDEEREQNNYIQMVCDGHWPDYKNLEPDCDK